MLRIATQNVRLPEKGDKWKHRWAVRKQAHAHIFNENSFHVVALQELDKSTTESFSDSMHKSYHGWVVTPVAYGNALIYRRELIHSAGDAETVGYEVNAENCISGFTVHPLVELGTNTFFTLINTHLNGGDRGVRAAQATQLVEYVNKLAETKTTNIIVAGDFNSLSVVQGVFRKNGLVDLWKSSHEEQEATLNSYQGWAEDDEYKYEDEHVDGFFVKGDALVVASGVAPSIWHGVQASDHNAVWSDVILNKFDED